MPANVCRRVSAQGIFDNHFELIDLPAIHTLVPRIFRLYAKLINNQLIRAFAPLHAPSERYLSSVFALKLRRTHLLVQCRIYKGCIYSTNYRTIDKRN